MADTRQNVHELVDQLDVNQLAALEGFLQNLVIRGDGPLSEADQHAIAASRAYFRQGGEGVSFEDLASQCGFSVDELLSNPK